jgi:hypothetical protein
MIVRWRSCGQAGPGNTESEPFVLAVQKRASRQLEEQPIAILILRRRRPPVWLVGTRPAKRPKPKTVIRFPDLEQPKNAVLNSLAAASSQESYRHAIDEFIGWYCSEPRLVLNRTVVLRYRFFLEQNNLALSTINVRLAAVRRLAYEAASTAVY